MAPHDYRAPRKTNNSKIALARRAKGWTQAMLADAIGTSAQQIQAWEVGTRKPKMAALIKIGQALGVDWQTLIDQDAPQ